MVHDWVRLPSAAGGLGPAALTLAGLQPPMSDVHRCANCGAITLSEPGGPPDERVLLAVNPSADPCEVGTARRVLES